MNTVFLRNTSISLTQCIIVLLIAGSASPNAGEPPVIPEQTKNEIRKRVDNLYATAVAVGVLDANGTSFFSYGTLDLDRGGGVTEDSLFDVGGVSKTFTATILADLAERGELSMTNLIQDYLPAGYTAPVFGAKEIGITLEQLATHTSGLPPEDDNRPGVNTLNDYEGYTIDRMYDFLSGYKLPRAPGFTYEFSNYGVGLLGQLLANFKGLDFEALLRERVTDVLRMKDTVIEMSPAQESRYVTRYLGVVRYPKMVTDAIAPSMGGCSTTRDLLTYLGANLGLIQTPLYRAMTNAQQARKATGDGAKVGLVWNNRGSGTNQWVEYGGNSLASFAFAGFIPGQPRAVVVLSTGYDVATDIGRNLLSTNYAKLISYAVPAQVPTRFLRRYAGVYDLDAGRSIRIELERAHLICRYSWNQSLVPTLYSTPSARNNMFRASPSYDASATFTLNAQGEVKGVQWSELGGIYNFTRTGDVELPPELSISRSNSGLELELIGDAGKTYVIEASADLRTWAPVSTNTVEDGPIKLSPAKTMRFYQAR